MRGQCFVRVFLTGFTVALVALPVFAFRQDTNGPVAPRVAFDQYDVLTGSAKRQTVLTGFLLGGSVAELIAVDVDGPSDRRLRIYEFNNTTWEPTLDTMLRPEVLFVDVVRIGGRDRFVTYAPGRLSWFDPESATERELVAVNSNFNASRAGEIPHVDIARDLTNDDRDDLLVPDVGGFWVFVQGRDGSFADPVKMGSETRLERITGTDGYRYDPWAESRIHQMDYDRDGRSDLVFWNEDHFDVHLQDARGLFSPMATTFRSDVVFDSDELSFLTAGEMTGRVLRSLTDLNADGVGDLLVFSLQGRSISRKRSAYEVHFGASSPGATVFSSRPDLTIQSDGIQIAMDRHDFDLDGQIDMMLTKVKVKFLKKNLFTKFRGTMGGEVYLHLEFYRMGGGLYPDQPNTRRRIHLQYPGANRGPGWVPLDLALRGGKHERRITQKKYLRAFNSVLLIGDVTGDGRLDLLIGWDKESRPGIWAHDDDLLKVYVGVPGPDLFAPRAQDVVFAMPSQGETAWLVDINQDGKQDLLLHYPSSTDSNRLTMLIAQ